MLACQSPRPKIPIHVLHRALYDAAPVRRGVEDLAAARVDSHVGNGPVHSRLFEEDQVPGRRSDFSTLRPKFHCTTGLSGIVTHLLKTRLVKQEQSSDS